MDATTRRIFLKCSAGLAAGLGLSRLAAWAQDSTLRLLDAPPSTQPATAPAAPPDGQGVLRRPAQAEVLKGLLQRQERPMPLPIPPAGVAMSPSDRGIGPDGQPLLLEGAFIVERPGRIEPMGGERAFVFQLGGEGAGFRRMRLLPCQLLEVVEREMSGGHVEFVVSGEVLRYRGENFLLLRKVLRRMSHGNVGPA